jgi:hypothetical protein
MSISPATLAHPNRAPCNENETSHRLRESYSVIENIFDESFVRTIPEWCKSLRPHNRCSGGEELYNNPANQIYTSIQFDANYKIIDQHSYLKKGIPSSSSELNQFVCTLVERFAKELKLIGCHEINVDLYRIRYSEKTNMERFQLGWHFDRYAKSTLVATFQNDFPYEEGELSGLDIAENKDEGPHDPLKSNPHEPKDGYISCPYAPNGAILFHGRQGKIIHRRSILERPLLPDATRTTVQIKLKDPDWPERIT